MFMIIKKQLLPHFIIRGLAQTIEFLISGRLCFLGVAARRLVIKLSLVTSTQLCLLIVVKLISDFN